MKKELSFVIVLILMFSFVLTSLVKAEISTESIQGTICTMDAKQCPDGSYVSRTGPKCEYAICKGEDKRNLDERERKEEMMKKTKKEVFVPNIKNDRESFLAELKTKKEAWKAEKAEKKQEFCSNAKEMIGKRFETVIKQLEVFQTRVEDSIKKLEVEKKDTKLAKDALALSISKLKDAKIKLAEIKKLVPEICTDVTPETFEKIKIGAREAKNLLKESREYLHTAVAEIKILRNENKNDKVSE